MYISKHTSLYCKKRRTPVYLIETVAKRDNVNSIFNMKKVHLDELLFNR